MQAARGFDFPTLLNESYDSSIQPWETHDYTLTEVRYAGSEICTDEQRLSDL
jgi:hypothetical protein